MDTLAKFVWLIDLLQRKKQLTLKEICNYWSDSGLNSEGNPLIERTFHRWCSTISDIFGIGIVCTKVGGYTYSIENLEELEKNTTKSWIK